MQARPANIPLLTQAPGNALVLLMLTCMVLIWSWLMAISHQAPDLDGMEELVWAASMELGYTKHPPLPSWFMYLATQIFGRTVWLPFFMGQLFAAIGLWFLWLLGCEITTRRKAFIAVLLVSITAYFSLRATIYNHNTAQLWSITASIWLFYKSMTSNQYRYWAALGAVCGLAMLTKYSAVIQFTAFFLFILRVGALRNKQVLAGIGIASIVFSIVIAPHLYWLIQNSFEPLLYADSSLKSSSYLSSINSIFWFSLDQIGRLSPMLLILAAWYVWQRRHGYRGPGSAANDYSFTPTEQEKNYFHTFSKYQQQFLLWVGLTPFISTVVISAALGNSLEASWGSTFFVLTGFFGLWLLHGPEHTQMRRIFLLVVSAHLIMAIGYALARGPIAEVAGYSSRSNYPAQQLSRLALDHWQEHQPGRPLRVITSNTWLGGNIAIHISPDTMVYIDAQDKKSPWFKPGTALDCGALLAYSEAGRATPSLEILQLYKDAIWKGTDYVDWPNEKGKQIDFNWAVIPATEHCLQNR